MLDLRDTHANAGVDVAGVLHGDIELELIVRQVGKGLADVDTRFRQRYVDLVVNERTREIFEIRRKVLVAIRDYLNSVRVPQIFAASGGCPVIRTSTPGALS